MADLNRLNELHLEVRSKILEQISRSLKDNGAIAATTQYTKSDGTNYGMYQKADPASLTDIWNTVINQQRAAGAVADVASKISGPSN